MPIYSNVPLCVRRGRSYKSGGWMYRRMRPKVEHHMEAPIYVGTGFAKEIGSVDLEGGKIYDDYGIIVTDIGGPTLSVTPRGKSRGLYSSINMFLYTISVYGKIDSRRDAVLIRSNDVKYIEVLSGGGYAHDKRKFDNIVLRVSCTGPRIIVVQRDKARDSLSIGDTIFAVTKEGVNRTVLSIENLEDTLAELNIAPELDDWTYI